MNLKSLARARHLIRRAVRHHAWRASGMRFAKRRSDAQLPHCWVEFECPVVNHPTQAHLLNSKLHNMRLAVGKFDGLVLAPGEILSFWNIIGRPSKAKGFMAGPTFEYGQMVTSYGGGLCQMSGLIFNLALEAGCEILERSSHSLDAYGDRRYLPLGRDATVAWMSKDLAFRNTTGHPLRISVGVEPTRAYGRIESDVQMPFHVRVRRTELPSPRSDARTVYMAAYVEREIGVGTSGPWLNAGIFSSEYRMLAQSNETIKPLENTI